MGCAAPSPFHWRDLRALPRDEILRKPGVTPAGDGAFDLGFLDGRYRIDPVTERVEEIQPVSGRQLSPAFQILLIAYLIAPDGGAPDGEPVSEKDLPGGATFFQGPHAIPAGPVLDRFGRDPDGFETAGRALGAEPVGQGDRALRFLPFPPIPVTFVLWQADEEFAASLGVQFDRSIARWFGLDMVFLLSCELVERLASF